MAVRIELQRGVCMFYKVENLQNLILTKMIWKTAALEMIIKFYFYTFAAI